MSDHRLSPQLSARFLGLALAGMGLLLLVMTMLVVLVSLPPVVFTITAVLVVTGVFVLGFLLTRKWYVVRLTSDGYQVKLVRGAGVKAARWTDVQDAVTTEVAGDPCVVLRLRDGRTTTIPVAMVATDRETFARDLHEHLRRYGRKA